MAVHLRDEGRRDDPMPLVLLHGTSASLHTWDGWVAELGPGRRILRFDLPGFGLTGPFAGGDYTVRLVCQSSQFSSVTHVLESLVNSQPILCGTFDCVHGECNR